MCLYAGKSVHADRNIPEVSERWCVMPLQKACMHAGCNTTLTCFKLFRAIIDCMKAFYLQSLTQMIGSSAPMQAVSDRIARAAISSAPVMIIGETGTGKELAAQALHAQGNRARASFVALNCAAIPAELLESEIFGHIKGSFTGAIGDREGAARRADGGILFLDEVTEMPVDLQAKLLRFIQTGVVTPVGGNDSVTVDVKFISTTNRDPVEAVKTGRLREDLYYRLCTIQLHLPPLRVRGHDILRLAEFFLRKYTIQEKRRFTGFGEDAVSLLMRHSWPGNVRELEAVVRAAVIFHDGEIVDAAMLDISSNTADVFRPTEGAVILPLAETERIAIQEAIAYCRGNITEAARLLGVNPSTIHRKQKQWSRI